MLTYLDLLPNDLLEYILMINIKQTYTGVLRYINNNIKWEDKWENVKAFQPGFGFSYLVYGDKKVVRYFYLPADHTFSIKPYNKLNILQISTVDHEYESYRSECELIIVDKTHKTDIVYMLDIL